MPLSTRVEFESGPTVVPTVPPTTEGDGSFARASRLQQLPYARAPLVPSKSAVPGRDAGPPRSFLMQKWITVRATSPVLSVTQEDAGWRDLGTFADAAFWVEVGEVTPLSGGTVELVIESSPTFDEVNFVPRTVSYKPNPEDVVGPHGPNARVIRARVIARDRYVINQRTGRLQ